MGTLLGHLPSSQVLDARGMTGVLTAGCAGGSPERAAPGRGGARHCPPASCPPAPDGPGRAAPPAALPAPRSSSRTAGTTAACGRARRAAAQHTSPVLAAHLPAKAEGQHPASGKGALASPWPLAGVPGEQRGSAHPLPHRPVLWVPPGTAPVPALLWAPAASLTGAPAGRCPGAAELGRAGGWGRAAPPAAARRGHWDLLRLPRLQSCRGTEPRGTGSPRQSWELPAPAHNPPPTPSRASSAREGSSEGTSVLLEM